MAVIVDRRGAEFWVWDTNTLDWVRGEQPATSGGGGGLTEPVQIEDGGGSITVDGTVTVQGDVGTVDQLDLTNSNPIVAAIVDANGDQITSFGGTQYADGAARGTATGTLVMGDDGTNVQSIGAGNSGVSSLTSTQQGLNTRSVVYLRNNDSTVTPWAGDTAYHQFGSNPFPWVKAIRSSFLSTSDTTINALNAQLDIDIKERNYEALGVFLRNSNLIGTVQFLPTPGGNSVPMRVFNTRTGEWETGSYVNPTDDTLYMVPCAGLANVIIRCTAYTSGSLLATYAGGPGVSAVYSEISGSTLGANSGVDIGDVTINNAAGASAVNIQDGGNVITINGEHISGDAFDAADGMIPLAVVNDLNLWAPLLATTSAPTSGSQGAVVRQVGLPAAAALADNTANPTLTKIQTFPMVWDGSTWDRTPGTSADGLTVNLGINNDVTVTSGNVVVTANDLDIRPLTFPTDTVNVSGSSVTVINDEPQFAVTTPAYDLELDFGSFSFASQTTEGYLRTMAGALVAEAPVAATPDKVAPLSMTSEGRLRVSSEPSTYNQIWQNTFNNPWGQNYVPKHRNGWN